MIQLFYNLLKISRNAQNTEAALNVADCLWKLGLLDAEINHLKKDENAIAYMQGRRLMKPYDLNELSRLPVGTLGRTYSDHMAKNNLKPDFYKKIEIENDATYVMMRMRETHDLWHVITGFGTEVTHELGLQAFMYAQIETPLAPILIGARTLVSTFKNPREVIEIFNNISIGWTMGRKAKPLFGMEWDLFWTKPLQEIRTELNIAAI
jgi:ubiquinone biosynthesis protein COQ4